MSAKRCCAVLAVAFSCAVISAAAPERAQAFNPLGTICGIGGVVSGAIGKACSVGGKLLGVGKKLIGGGTTTGPATRAQAAIGLAAIGAWVLVGAKTALHETAKVVGATTSPRLTTTWFSATYWRMAALGALLTTPFLFAAAIQALLRSDLALLLRAALGYLPLALVAVGVAAPITMLLLGGTDEMCTLIASATGDTGVHFLARAGKYAGILSVAAGSPFLAFLCGLIAAFGALALWLELLMREAAVYVVVLMLPLAFAAMVWPARRVWAIRAVELLVALILSKFAIVAVLSLGGAALDQTPLSGLSGMLAGGVLVILGAFAPWALIRLLPLAELASGAAGALTGETWRAGRALASAGGLAEVASERLTTELPQPEDTARSQRERLAELPPPMPPGDPSEAPQSPAAAGAAGARDAPAVAGAAHDPPAAPDTAAADEGGAGLPPQFRMEDLTWELHLGPENWPPGPVDGRPADEDSGSPDLQPGPDDQLPPRPDDRGPL